MLAILARVALGKGSSMAATVSLVSGKERTHFAGSEANGLEDLVTMLRLVYGEIEL